MLIFWTYQHGNRHFHSHIRCCQAICTTVTYYEWDLSFFFLLFVRMFCELVQNHFMISASFSELLFILSLSLQAMILFLQQHKSPKEIQENETVAHLALNAFCCGWQLCQTSYVLVPYDLCYVCTWMAWNVQIVCMYVCVHVDLHVCWCLSFIYFRSYKL